ncbi:MBL fold metallo-hydrolase [Conexibacter sp. SYSU D00693]|uniref:MBL fold metallo-hydrolase n=1 Tax=Conexibacter sp. SYSU D00693 TaxID=2812560 RepID=UPI001F122214|nr:MBL fold metallo-hydrolase [Conexibacter sp. SYSU D00693]
MSAVGGEPGLPPAVTRLRADNPSPLTLDGTNTWVVGRDPCWVVDPGPRLPEHLDAIVLACEARGGCAGVLTTHAHADHVEALEDVLRATGAPHLRPADGEQAGPFTAVATPGHAPDHLAFVTDGGACCTGDAVLGWGSVFVAPEPGALRSYLDALRRLRAMHLRILLPGHGPPVFDPAAKIDEYLAHRLERERKLVAALDAGARTVDALLDAAWDDVPSQLRPAAAVTLGSHLHKLAEDGALPTGVQWPPGVASAGA